RTINDIKDIIKKYAIDAVISRLPSELGYEAIEVCKELNLPYAVEIVGCTYDTIINYKFKPWYNYRNLIVKLYAPIAYKKMQSYVKSAKYAIYVTENFLQNRYPTHPSAT